jgi:hypothetical protein
MKKIFFTLLLFSSFLSASLIAQEKKQNNVFLTYQFPTDSIRKIETDLLRGIVIINGNMQQKNSVEIAVSPFTNKGQNLSKEEIQTLLNECFEVGTTVKNGTLVVIARQIKNLPKTYKWWQLWEATRYPADNALNFTIRITIGGNADIDVKTKSGGIQVQDVSGTIALQSGYGVINVNGCSGDISLYTESGSMKLTQLRGAVDARSGYGSIYADSCSGNISLYTESGSMKLTQLRGAVDARSGYGSIHADSCSENISLYTKSGNINLDNISGGLIANTSYGYIQAAMTDVTGDVKLLGNGGIQLVLPNEKGYNLQVGAHSIQVAGGLTNFSGIAESKKIEGSILNGGNLVHIKAQGNARIAFK